MSGKRLSEVRGSLEYRIIGYWLHAGVFDADKIIADTKKIVDFIKSQKLTLDQLNTAISKESASVQNDIKNNIHEGATLQELLNWKNKKDGDQMMLLVNQLICSRGAKSADEIINMLKVLQQYACPPLKYIKDITNDEREKYNFRQTLIERITENNNFKLPDIDVISALGKLEDYLFYPE